MLYEEFLNSPSHKNHNGDTVEVTQVEIVNTSLGGPALHKDCDLTENAHYL